MESTGVFTTREKGGVHLKQGAKSVIISVPFADAPMLVMGVSHEMHNNLLKKGCQQCFLQHQLLSPLAKVIHINFIIVEGFMTTVHDIADTQKTLDNSLGSYGMMAVELPRT